MCIYEFRLNFQRRTLEVNVRRQSMSSTNTFSRHERHEHIHKQKMKWRKSLGPEVNALQQTRWYTWFDVKLGHSMAVGVRRWCLRSDKSFPRVCVYSINYTTRTSCSAWYNILYYFNHIYNTYMNPLLTTSPRWRFGRFVC